jgi:hypothetical protein
MIDLNNISNWACTGANVPDLAGAYTLPAGENGDRDRRELLAESFTLLYSAVGSAQRAPRSKNDPELDGVHQMIVASAALTASEAESFLTLSSVGLEASAAVHLRSISETVRRLVTCRDNHTLALQLYRTALPTWLKALEPLHRPGVPAPTPGQKTMQDVEREPAFQAAKTAAQAQHHVLADIEWSANSKRTHGDIIALIDVSQKLSRRDGDVRFAINHELPVGVLVNARLMRAIGLTLFATKNLAEEFGIDMYARLAGLVTRFDAMQERDRQTGVLAVPTI